MANRPRISGFREAISPYDEQYAHSTFSSTHSGHPPSYQPWSELNHNVSPQDPADVNWSGKPHPSTEMNVMSPGLESVWAGEGDKEVFTQPTLSVPPPAPEKRDTRFCGLKRSLFWLLLAAAFLAVVALALGLGLGLGTQNKHKSSSSAPLSPNYYIGGALDPKYFSKKGAFNGTGLALAEQSFGSGEYGELVLYYQHHTGSIRSQRLTNGGWIGGTESEIVASDAKNSTPLSVVSYSLSGISTWHIFYVDENNHLREKTNSNATNIWIDGALSGENHTVLDADQVGVQACWYGNDYGDSDYKHTPLPDQPTTSKPSDGNTDVGMHIWYASDDQTFQQLGWRHGDQNWTWQQSWPKKNGHAGVGCYSWGGGTSTYVMFVNLENTAEVWWKDTNTNTTSTTSHPINEWVNTSMSVPNVHPSTSLGYTNVFYAQGQDGWIYGHNITWASENSTMAKPFKVDLGQGIPGTKMSVTALPDSSGGDSLVVFYQQEGEDITYATRDLLQGTWTGTPLNVP